MLKPNKIRGRALCRGFTLSETLVTISIIGVLSAVAVPEYTRQKEFSCQKPIEAQLSTLLSQAQAYNDEFGTGPNSWKELDKIATVMTATGPATSNDFDWIETPACNYKVKANKEGNQYTFIAAQKGSFPLAPEDSDEGIDPQKNTYNVVACVNVATGASDISRGDGKTATSPSDLTCGAS